MIVLLWVYDRIFVEPRLCNHTSGRQIDNNNININDYRSSRRLHSEWKDIYVRDLGAFVAAAVVDDFVVLMIVQYQWK